MDMGGLQIEQDGQTLRILLSGVWGLPSAAGLDRRIAAIHAGGVRHAVIDTSGLERLDTAGAVLLHRLWRRLAAQGAKVEWPAPRPEYRTLFDYVADSGEGKVIRPPKESGALALVAWVGWLTLFFLREARRFIAFIGRVAESAAKVALQPRRLRLTSMVHHMEEAGLRAIPIVGLLSFLIGVVMAYQGADQLRRFGAEIFVVDLIGISVLRELGVLLTAILIAGRSGSAFTAQIGTMKVNEEIAAMRILGLDPVEILVLPRMFALILTMPLLTFYADIMGLFGGAIMAWSSLNIDLNLFAQRLQDAVSLKTFFVGLMKAPVFAALIGMVGCYEGLRVKQDAASVGRLTTRSVVQSIFLVIVVDALFSIMFSIMGI